MHSCYIQIGILVTVFTPTTTTTTTTTTTVPQSSEENTDTSTTTSSTTSTSTTTTTTTTLPPANTTTTTTTVPDNCFETKLAEFKSGYPELFGQVGASDTGQQVGDYYNGGEIVEISSRSNGSVSFRYRYGESEYNSTIEEG